MTSIEGFSLLLALLVKCSDFWLLHRGHQFTLGLCYQVFDSVYSSSPGQTCSRRGCHASRKRCRRISVRASAWSRLIVVRQLATQPELNGIDGRTMWSGYEQGATFVWKEVNNDKQSTWLNVRSWALSPTLPHNGERVGLRPYPWIRQIFEKEGEAVT